MADTRNVGTILKKLRKSNGYSVQKLADVCQRTRQAYWLYEAGKRNPSDDVKVRIADFYGMPVGDIFYRRGLTTGQLNESDN